MDIASSQVMPNTTRTNRRFDPSIFRHDDGAMEADTSPFAAIVSTVALVSLIMENKIGLSLPIANHARPMFP